MWFSDGRGRKCGDRRRSRSGTGAEPPRTRAEMNRAGFASCLYIRPVTSRSGGGAARSAVPGSGGGERGREGRCDVTHPPAAFLSNGPIRYEGGTGRNSPPVQKLTVK